MIPTWYWHLLEVRTLIAVAVAGVGAVYLYVERGNR